MSTQAMSTQAMSTQNGALAVIRPCSCLEAAERDENNQRGRRCAICAISLRLTLLHLALYTT